jgi:hypothetical protein
VAGKRQQAREIVLKLRQAEVLKLQAHRGGRDLALLLARVAMIYSSVDINLRIVHLFRSRTLIQVGTKRGSEQHRRPTSASTRKSASPALRPSASVKLSKIYQKADQYSRYPE